MTTLNKTVRLGIGPYGNIYAKIKFDGKNLSITGVEGPLSNGDCKGSCGQIIMSGIEISEFAPGWDKLTANKFIEYWDNWHLNNMQAGTPAQTAIIDQYKADNPDWRYDYTEACKILSDNDLLLDNGYKYGSSWLSIDVPEDVIEFFNNLPETDKNPAWV